MAELESVLSSDDSSAIISPSGNVVLCIITPSTSSTSSTYTFRVSSSRLCSNSTYFRNLLSPDTHFAEGRRVASQHASLAEKYPDKDWERIPAAELPQVEIGEIGQTSPLKQPRLLIRDFLLILHEASNEPAPRKMPMNNLANLVAVADRFDAMEALRRWAKRKGYGNISPAKAAMETEEILRQRIFIGLKLELDVQLYHASTRLIWIGSKKWERNYNSLSRLNGHGDVEDCGDDDDDDDIYVDEPAWWNLPQTVEEELSFRRHAILKALGSLQNDLVMLYASSKSQICRLGYDSSRQCDSFQLGEFVKFLTSRTSTLEFMPSFLPSSGSNVSTSRSTHKSGTQGQSMLNIPSMIANLRQAPAYQINEHHSHCGPRKVFLARLEQMSVLISRDIGLCIECMKAKRDGGSSSSGSNRKGHQSSNGASRATDEYFWSQTRPLPIHPKLTQSMLMSSTDCVVTGSMPPAERRAHALARDFFCAGARDWDLHASSSYGSRGLADAAIENVSVLPSLSSARPPPPPPSSASPSSSSFSSSSRPSATAPRLGGRGVNGVI